MHQMPEPVLSLRCQHCHRRDDLLADDLYSRLRELGFLRRGGEPSLDLALELSRNAISEGRWGNCPACGQPGYGITTEPREEEAADWGDPVRCEQCRSIIPTERLEVFPSTKLCSKCQVKVESGAPTGEAEYCPRCGDLMQLKRVQSPLAGYRMHCPTCRKTF